MKEFLEYLLKQILSKPEEMSVEESHDGEYTKLLIKVSQEDMGVVIGKEGRTIKSIRNLIKSKAIKDGSRVNVELYDEKIANN